MTAGRSYRLEGRLSARELDAIQGGAREIAFNTTAAGSLARVAYGEVSVDGDVSAVGYIGSDLIVRVIWLGCGECYQIERTYINDEEIPAGVGVRHYRGADWQGVDAWLAEAILLYDDTLVLEKPGGKLGACYSVFRIPDGDIANTPGFRAVVKGRLVPDPGNAGSGDPFHDLVGASIHFTGADGATTATDSGPIGHTVTFSGDAQIQGNQLQVSGGGSVSIADHISLRPDDTGFTLELKFTPSALSGAQVLASLAGTVLVRASSDDLQVYLSSNGSSYDVFSGYAKTSAFVVGQEYDIKIEHLSGDNQYLIYIDGEVVAETHNTLAVHSSTSGWTLGNSLNSKIRSFRFTKGAYRCGGNHDASGLPFFDVGSWVPGTVYSDNPALCGYELASNALYGLGASVSGVGSSRDWCDSLLSATLPRCRLSMLIDKARPAVDWLRVIATYGEFHLVNDQGGFFFIPDKPVGADNPSGQQVVLNSDFQAADGWTLDAGMFIGSSLLIKWVATGTALQVSQPLFVESGVSYAIEADVQSVTGGEVNISVGGANPIGAITTGGLYQGVFTATGNTLVIAFDAATVSAIRRVSVRRLYWLVDKVAENSLTLEGLPSSDTPTKVNVRYTEPNPDKASWSEAIASFQLPGVEDGSLPLRETTVPMRHVFRQEEAINKAESRARRLQDRVKVTAVCKDMGLLFQRGTVVQLRLPYRGIDILVLLDSVEMIDYGRYRISGLVYSMDHYPSELPQGGGSIPQGLVVPLNGSSVPSGWAVFSDADGKYIVGAGGAYQPGDTGGSATSPGISGDTTEDGGHSRDTSTPINVKQVKTDRQGEGVVLKRWDVDLGSTIKGLHLHSYDTGALTPDLYRRESVLIQKTGGAGTRFPADSLIFGLNGVTVANLVRSTAYQGRLLQAAGASINAGLANQFVTATTGVTDDTHAHHDENLYSDQEEYIDFPFTWYDLEDGGGTHSHDFTVALQRNIKRFRLALYAGSGEFKPAPGVMGFWPLLLGDIPAPWYLCDGANGTPDLRDYFIEVASQGNEETSEGDNTLSISGVTSAVEHDHKGVERYEYKKVIQAANDTHSHFHSVDGSVSYTPPFYALGVVMYNP